MEEQKLFSTQEACKRVGLTPKNFALRANRLGITAAKEERKPSGGRPQKFWTLEQINLIGKNTREDVIETEDVANTVTAIPAQDNDDELIARNSKETAPNSPPEICASTPPVTTEVEPASVVDTETLISEPLENKSLEQLAEEANLFAARGDDCLKQGLTYYFAAGRRLNEAKSRLEHGHWQNWLAENFPSSADTAQNYMRLAKRFSESKSETFRNLGLAAAIKLLALPEGDEQEFIDAQAAAGKPVENQSAREIQRNVKAFKQLRAIPKETAEEPTPDLSNVGEKFSLFGRETDAVTEVTHDSEFVSETITQDSAKQEETAADDTAPTTKTVDNPVTNEFKLAAIKTFETWLNYIEVIGSTISETQLNSLLKLCGEYWHELEKQFTYEKKLARIAEHILKSVKEICAQNTELAVKIKLSCAELEQAQENKKK